MLRMVTANIQEIDAAARGGGSGFLNAVVADASAKRIYWKKRGCGVLWSLFYRVVALLSGNGSVAAAKLQKALRHTLFHYHKAERRALLLEKKFLETFKQKCRDYPCDEKSFAQVKCALALWHDLYHPLDKMATKSNIFSLVKKGDKSYSSTNRVKAAWRKAAASFNAAINRFLSLYFFIRKWLERLSRCSRKINYSHTPLSLPLAAQGSKTHTWMNVNVHSCANATTAAIRHLINLERDLQCPTPCEPLAKVARGKNIGKEDESAIQSWVEKIVKPAKNSVTQRALHKAAAAFAALFASGSKYPNAVAKIEYFLAKKGALNLLSTPNPKHERWRNALCKGSELFCNDKRCAINAKVFNPNGAANDIVAFDLQNDSDHLLWIAANDSILGITEQMMQEKGWGLPTAEVQTVSRDGTCSLVEKLLLPLNGITYDSTQPTLTAHDLDYAEPIANLVKWMIQNNGTIQGLSAKTAFYDRTGSLKSAIPAICGPFDFLALQRFVKECSNGNTHVEAFLMEQSSLARHRYARFLRDAATTRHDIETLALTYEITDKKIVAHAKRH